MKLEDRIRCISLLVPSPDLEVPPPATARCGHIWFLRGGPSCEGPPVFSKPVWAMWCSCGSITVTIRRWATVWDSLLGFKWLSWGFNFKERKEERRASQTWATVCSPKCRENKGTAWAVKHFHPCHAHRQVLMLTEHTDGSTSEFLWKPPMRASLISHTLHIVTANKPTRAPFWNISTHLCCFNPQLD